MLNLVLLHGWATNSRIWEKQRVALQGQVNLLIPDLPTWQADWLGDYLSRLPLADTLVVGWSLGGMLALESLANLPRPPRTMVLVGVGASFCRRPDYPAGVAPAVVRAMRRRLQQQRAQVVGDFYALMLAPTEKAWEGPLSSLLPSSLAALPLEEGLDYLLQKDLRPSLLNLPGVPLVVVQGEQDRISPQTQAQYWKDQVPAARLEIYPEVGHLPFLTQAERFNKLLVELLHEDR